MIRNFKALGLALVAVFAFSALSASGASAQHSQQGVLTAPEPVTLTGEDTGEPTDNALTGPLGRISCAHGTYTGHKYDETPHELIPSGATTATITPSYSGCHAIIPILGTRPATVTMNGCDYVFHVGTTTPEDNTEGTYGVTATIDCPDGKAIEIDIYKSGSVGHPEGDLRCRIEVPGGQSLTGAHLTHTTGEDDDIDLTGTFTNIKEVHKGVLCGEGEGTAALDVDVTIEGHNELGEEIPVTITD